MIASLWLDDVREPPSGYHLWAKTADEAISMLQEHRIVHCSLDHDLADSHYDPEMYDESKPMDRSKYVEKTGYAVLEWMLEHDAWVSSIRIHTMNPKGARDMINLLENRAPDYVKFRRASTTEPA